MEHRGKKPNSFAVMPTKNGKNIVIELRDPAECARPSVKKDIHIAVERCLRRMIARILEENEACQTSANKIFPETS